MTRAEAITDLITLFCGEAPPFPITVERLSDLPDAEHETLRVFILNHAKLQWLTGTGIIESIDVLVDEAIGNSELHFEQNQPYFQKPPHFRIGDAVRIRRGQKTSVGIAMARKKVYNKEYVALRVSNGAQTDVLSANIVEVLHARSGT